MRYILCPWIISVRLAIEVHQEGFGFHVRRASFHSVWGVCKCEQELDPHKEGNNDYDVGLGLATEVVIACG